MSSLQIPDNTTLKDLYERFVSQLLALKAEDLKVPYVLRDRVLEQSQALHGEFTKVLPQVSDTFSETKAQAILHAYNDLNDLAFVYFFTSMEAEKPFSDQEKEQFQSLATKVRDNDAKYMKWARAIFHSDQDTNKFLDKVHAGRGHQDDAEDVLSLTHLLLTAQNIPWPNGFFTQEELRKAEADARLFLWMLLGRDDKKPPTGSPGDIRIRAYNLWLEAYQTVAQAGRTIVADEQEGLHRFPRISSPKLSAAPSAAPNPTPTSPPALVDNFGKA